MSNRQLIQPLRILNRAELVQRLRGLPGVTVFCAHGTLHFMIQGEHLVPQRMILSGSTRRDRSDDAWFRYLRAVGPEGDVNHTRWLMTQLLDSPVDTADLYDAAGLSFGIVCVGRQGSDLVMGLFDLDGRPHLFNAPSRPNLPAHDPDSIQQYLIGYLYRKHATVEGIAGLDFVRKYHAETAEPIGDGAIKPARVRTGAYTIHNC